MEKSRIQQLLDSVKIQTNFEQPEIKFQVMDTSYDRMLLVPDTPGIYCQVQELSNMFSWKRGFAYLWTGSPNAGKTTISIYMMLLMAFYKNWKWCIWSPEMEDHHKKVGFIQKDLIYTMVWTIAGQTPYQYFAQKHGVNCMPADEIQALVRWINEHFYFVHLNTRTPDAIIEAFSAVKDRYNVDGFLLDPWKSVKQQMDQRSDLWMEDTLMTIKEFTQETETVFNYVVHPKSLKDYTDEDGNFRVITPFDLNGGAAWFNSMDVIISIRRLKDNTEFHTQKIRKQHLVGVTDTFTGMTFDKMAYRFLFNHNDPFKEKISF